MLIEIQSENAYEHHNKKRKEMESNKVKDEYTPTPFVYEEPSDTDILNLGELKLNFEDFKKAWMDRKGSYNKRPKKPQFEKIAVDDEGTFEFFSHYIKLKGLSDKSYHIAFTTVCFMVFDEVAKLDFIFGFLVSEALTGNLSKSESDYQIKLGKKYFSNICHLPLQVLIERGMDVSGDIESRFMSVKDHLDEDFIRRTIGGDDFRGMMRHHMMMTGMFGMFGGFGGFDDERSKTKVVVTERMLDFYLEKYGDGYGEVTLSTILNNPKLQKEKYLSKIPLDKIAYFSNPNDKKVDKWLQKQKPKDNTLKSKIELSLFKRRIFLKDGSGIYEPPLDVKERIVSENDFIESELKIKALTKEKMMDTLLSIIEEVIPTGKEDLEKLINGY